MSDLISRKALLEDVGKIEIQNWVDNQGRYNPFIKSLKIITCIENAPPVEAAPQWIPCSEKLPKERENPITKNFYPYPVIIELGNKLKDIRFYYFGRGHWWHGLTKMDGLVTHWFDIYSIPEPNEEQI